MKIAVFHNLPSGGAKRGTSWIAKCLAEHPQIFIPGNDNYLDQEGKFSKKEFLWFKDNIIAYKCQDFKKLLNLPSGYDKEGIFPYLSFFKSARENQVKGEISTVYVYDSSAASKIKKEFPDVKILAYLRNPIKRTYSRFYFNKYTTRVDLSETFKQAIKKISCCSVYPNSSLYYQCLKPYFDLFPRENILVLIYEDIEKDPLKFIQNIYRSLGIDDSFVPPSLNEKINPTVRYRYQILFKVQSNIAKIIRRIYGGFLIDIIKKTKARKLVESVRAREIVKRPPMKLEIRKYLPQVFAKNIKHLEKLIGLDLSFWRENENNSKNY